MSCNGCRVLRKGCSEGCVLRSCLHWIPTPEAQAQATIFLAKFFGRSDLLSFISAVPQPQRPALFQSLLYEACGRTVNPVDGAVGLLWSGNWRVCEEAVETVLAGGVLRPVMEGSPAGNSGGDHGNNNLYQQHSMPSMEIGENGGERGTSDFLGRFGGSGGGGGRRSGFGGGRRRSYAASFWTEEEMEMLMSSSSGMTSFESSFGGEYDHRRQQRMRSVAGGEETKLLNLFV